jgi:two-component system, chemotaxis family, sensor histidine kinase and response regulator PixL
LQRLSKHEETLNQLQNLPLQMQNFTTQYVQNFAKVKFDSLEMDVYTEFHLKLHEAIEEALQLQENAESIDLLLKQATQINDKKQKLTFSIIDNLVEARMLPLGDILQSFPQMIQKLGHVYKKLVELKLTGTEVLVDKAIVEKLYDPLLHLVRNAFDHGIEPPQVRQERGKSEQGLIEICAYHQGSQTIIEVRDDGQGLNFESIRNKAVELGFISANDEARSYSYNHNQSELLNIMFSTGFSTANGVNEISGRGMGLDIVRSQIETLNGSISVQSLPNEGTTFILKMPFSMTTDKLMLVQAGGVVYALLLESIEKILISSTQNIKEFEGNKILHLNIGKDEVMVGLHQLSELMHYKGSRFSSTSLPNIPSNSDTEVMKNPVLLLRRKQGVFALEVDQIIGEQELVIRPLGNAVAPPKYVYGCSNLANGNLILVIDGALLLESHEMPEKLDIAALPIDIYSNNKALPILGNIVPLTPLLPAANNIEVPSIQSLDRHNKLLKAVLVVDDAISLRQTLSLTLQKSGYQVIQAQNGIEALEKLQRHPEIQVVISDLEMPRMNGFELLGNLHQNPKFAKMPVVILTSRSAEKHRNLAQELGAKAYLTKPYLEHEFISIVEDLFNIKKEDSEQDKAKALGLLRS